MAGIAPKALPAKGDSHRLLTWMARFLQNRGIPDFGFYVLYRYEPNEIASGRGYLAGIRLLAGSVFAPPNQGPLSNQGPPAPHDPCS